MNPTNKNSSKSSAPPYAKILVDEKVDRAVYGMLVVNGWPESGKEDGLGEVRLRAVRAFHRGVVPPATVDEMKAFCAKIGRDLAIDRARKKRLERKWCAGPCEDPDEYASLQPSGEQRDPVDAGRQLEVAAELFREGRMPEHGADILEGVASLPSRRPSTSCRRRRPRPSPASRAPSPRATRSTRRSLPSCSSSGPTSRRWRTPTSRTAPRSSRAPESA
jgi:DNA-directed RNA polymerase specialized sigma24 family protein